MIQSKRNILNQEVEKIGDFNLNILLSVGLWRWVGYGFLILFFFDVIEILVPPNFLNPQWEFQVMGAIIERIAIPLIALLLIFFGGNYLRSRWEAPILKTLSWLTLVAGIILILLIPLGMVNTLRIYRQTNAQIDRQLNQRLEILEEVKTRLDQVQTEVEMRQLFSQLTNLGNAPEIQSGQQLELIKENLSEFIDTSRMQTFTQAETIRQQEHITLFKSSVKWNLGALICAVLFINAWCLTRWARATETFLW